MYAYSFRLGYRLGHVIWYILYHLLCVVVLSCSVFFSFCKTSLSGHSRGLCQCGAGDQQLAVLYSSVLSILYMILMIFE